MRLRLQSQRVYVLLIGLALSVADLGAQVRAQPVPPAPVDPTALPAFSVAPPTAAQLTERLRAAEALNRNLFTQLEQARQQQGDELKQLHERLNQLSQRLDAQQGAMTGTVAPAATNEQSYQISPVPDYTEGGLPQYDPAPGYPGSNVISPYRFPIKAQFGPGFQFFTEDDRFRLDIHYESQIEARMWRQGDQLPANSGLFFPRQRIFFDGHITKPIEYELSINRGVNNINILNAYLNFHVSDKFELRFGRFFTPFSYDQYAVSNYWLLTPERSLFVTNLSPNRQIGLMGWGYLFDKRLDYAIGTFNGGRNSFENLSNNMDVVAYLNARPFQLSERLPFAKFFNIGTSVAFGRQRQSPVPATFRVGAGSPDANIPSAATTPFLILNPNVMEQGDRLVGSVHAAYFYKSLSLIGEWQYGYGNYATAGNPSMQIPYSGYYVSAGYFLTGEHIERRTRVKPLRPFIPVEKDQRRGPGAWELTSRVSQLRLSDKIFTTGFADPTLWSNSATTTEVGMNWYWNEYVKFYAFWLHAEFGDAVQYRPGRFQKSADMFWLRAQLYF